MRNPVSEVRTGGEPGGERHLTGLIEQTRNPDRRARDAAFEELYRYVAGPMKALIVGCVGRRPGRPVLVTEALNDAVATLFVRWQNLAVSDTGHFRALVVQAVYWKVTAQRRANRRLFEALTDVARAAPEPAREPDAHDRFEAAVEALAEHELAASAATPLADAVKARHLIGLSAAADESGGAVRTFEAIGQVLGVTPASACKRYWKALEWLHETFPQVVPALPARKKAGRTKDTDSGGGG